MAEQLKIGDLVRRDSEDIWRILDIPERYEPFKDRARCLCARAPLGWLKPDGSRSKSWAKVGDEDTFIIADLEWLPEEALSSLQPAENTAPVFLPTSNRMLFSPAVPVADGQEISPSMVDDEDAGHAEFRHIEIVQSRGPAIAFEGKLLCTQVDEDPEPDTPLKMAVYQTAAGAFVAVSSHPADDHEASIRASVVAAGDDVQAAHFAVLDHFNWDPRAQAMVKQLGWSLRLEVG